MSPVGVRSKWQGPLALGSSWLACASIAAACPRHSSLTAWKRMSDVDGRSCDLLRHEYLALSAFRRSLQGGQGGRTPVGWRRSERPSPQRVCLGCKPEVRHEVG